MILFDLDWLITLLLISKVRGFRDSYSLTRVLAWKFNIINVVEITRKLEENKLIERTPDKGNDKYEITAQGVAYINRNILEGKPILYNLYNSERDFIDALLV